MTDGCSMILFCLCLVFLYAKGIKDMRSPSPWTSYSKLSRTPSGYLRSQTPTVPTSNLCDRAKLIDGAIDAHEVCHKACLDVKTEISGIHRNNHNSPTMRNLQSKCGTVNAGKCSFPTKVCVDPVCRCYSPYGREIERGISLCACHLSSAWIKMISYTRTGMQRLVSSSSRGRDRVKTGNVDKTRVTSAWGKFSTWLRPKTPGIGVRVEEEREEHGQELEPWQEQKEDDAEPEGSELVADFRMDGRKLRALLDTGSPVTLIPTRYANAKDIVELQIPRKIFSGDKSVFYKIHGKTTIKVAIENGKFINIKGVVIESEDCLVLGCDFFMEYAARIKILEGKTEITSAGTELEFRVKFWDSHLPGQLLALNTDPGGYSPVLVSVWLNNRETKIEIDTGSSLTIVDKDFVNPESIIPIEISARIHEDSMIAFKEATNITIWIGSALGIEGLGFTTMALVAPYKVKSNLFLGNEFYKHAVEIIDFKQRRVTFKSPRTKNTVTTSMMIIRTHPEYI